MIRADSPHPQNRRGNSSRDLNLMVFRVYLESTMKETLPQIPIIDISGLIDHSEERGEVARQIGTACRDYGFFYITGHGVSEDLQQRLEAVSHEFFAQSLEEKLKIRMAVGGRAWRGYFPVGDELTSGKADLKEGLYFGAELDETHPLVKARTPMHGQNLFPEAIPAMRDVVLEYLQAMTELGHTLMQGLALSLDLEESYFARRYTADPFILFRVFNYPPDAADAEEQWGVGEHTDYGVLTILKQDDSGGLQIKSHAEWLDAPPLENSFVCNIGDMLDRMTGGLYRSTPHRVKNPTAHNRLSFPFFFDPNFHAEVKPIDLSVQVRDDKDERWDQASVHEFTGTYGDYLLNKVVKVFPELRKEVG
jgi:isopenicillin N synthase-like dioxygenase